MKKRNFYFLILSLVAIGLGIFLYKLLVIGFPPSPHMRANIWNVEVRITFDASDEPIKVSLFIPPKTKRIALINENFVSRGYGLLTSTEAGNRRAVWSVRKAKGRQALYYRMVVQKAEIKELPVLIKPPQIEGSPFEGPHIEAAKSLLAEILEQSADLDTMVAVLLKRLNMEQPDENIRLLLGKTPSPVKKLQTAVSVLALNGNLARVANGIRLEEQARDVSFVHWLQVYDKKAWRDYNYATGEAEIPAEYMFWWHGTGSIVQSKGTKNLMAKLSVDLSTDTAISAIVNREEALSHRLFEFSLFSLPIYTQAVYRILLLVPVGAVVLVVFRNVIGIKTFGTFMPILIALSFRETQLLWGIVLFSTMVALGLGVRSYLEHLKLLLVPRLASVLITVVLLMAIFSILTHKLGLERGLSVALFPMVILTMTIERMSIVWEEQGASEALQQGLGSLTIASFAYIVMSNNHIEHLMFVFPELLLILLAGTILLGRYTGYRLTELFRFKVLSRAGHDV